MFIFNSNLQRISTINFSNLILSNNNNNSNKYFDDCDVEDELNIYRLIGVEYFINYDFDLNKWNVPFIIFNQACTNEFSFHINKFLEIDEDYLQYKTIGYI